MLKTPLLVKPLAAAVFLATLGANFAAAEEAPSAMLQQMQEQMRQMEARLQKAEQRAAAAEAKVNSMDGMQASKMRAEAKAKKMAGDAQADADYARADPKDDKNYKAVLGLTDDKPFAAFDLNYFYGRAAVATNFRGGQRETNDGRNTAFVNPLVSDNNAGRLGNELDTYIEPSFKVLTNPLRTSPGVTFGAQFTISTYTPERTQIDLPTNITTLDFFGFAKGAIPFLPDAEVWAGRRGYLNQFYINIIDRRSMVIGGDGGGINNISLGGFAKLDLAYLVASPFGGSNTSVNPLNPASSTYGEIRTNRGNINKQAGYIRLHDIELPAKLGQIALHAQFVHAEGGRALVSGDFQGGPGNTAFNNLNYTTGAYLPSSDGISIGLVHDYKLDFGKDKANKFTNHLYLGAGWGNEYDTTNANKLRASPYYAVTNTDVVGNGVGPINTTVNTLADAHAFKLGDQANLYVGKTFELEGFVAYEHQNSGRPNKPLFDQGLNNYFTNNTNNIIDPRSFITSTGTQDWVDVGLRPTYNLSPWFALVAEGTYQYINNNAFNKIRDRAGFESGGGHLFKFTIAPTVHYGAVGNYPVELRFFYTFSAWSDTLKGSIVGGDAYRAENTGHLVGTQAVLNF